MDRQEATPLEDEVGSLLKARGLTIAVAEACTAGLVGHLLTSVSGSSAYFYGGVLAYARSVKRDLLGVPQEVLETHGSVHPVTASTMAKRVRELCDSDIGVSTTGIAGPSGGTPQRPVGLFYVAISARDGYERCDELRFTHNDRNANRKAAAGAALELVREYVSQLG